MTMKITLWMLLILMLDQTSLAESKAVVAQLEHKLDYSVDKALLDKGHFQYFYSLLKMDEAKKSFVNLYQEQSETPVEKILETFMPLDTKGHWDPKDGNYLAVAKFSYLLPVPLHKIDEKEITSKTYLQKTLPRYEVTKNGDHFHVGGSFITPDFDVEVQVLEPDHPLVSKYKSGKSKAVFMHQYNFGKVFFVKTAKSSSSLSLYEELGPNRTLVTQYILSNIINVPTRELIRKGMIENLEDVVKGARSAFQKGAN